MFSHACQEKTPFADCREKYSIWPKGYIDALEDFFYIQFAL